MAGALRVIGPDGASRKARLVSVVSRPVVGSTAVQVARYKIAAPGGAWDATDSGTWTVRLLPSRAADTGAHLAGGRTVGTFTVKL